jgi:hypothetical protein
VHESKRLDREIELSRVPNSKLKQHRQDEKHDQPGKCGTAQSKGSHCNAVYLGSKGPRSTVHRNVCRNDVPDKGMPA